jgi:hypothetical protein
MNTASRKQATSKIEKVAKRAQSLLGDHRVAWYRWQFLRRNEEYQREYAAFEARFSEWLKENDGWIPRASRNEDPEGFSFFRREVAPAASLIMDRWGTNDPLDPAEGERFLYSLKLGKRAEDIKQELLEPELSEEEKQRIKTAKELRFIEVRIDIAETLDTILERLEERIETARNYYRVRIGPLPDFRKRPRIRLDQYESCLKVWDMRKQNLTFEQIACRLFPFETKNLAFRSTVTKRVRSQFQRAKELIEGGYRQIEC